MAKPGCKSNLPEHFLRNGGPGRKPGIPNKIPTGLKEKVLHACAVLEAEGKDLATMAQADPPWFWETFVKPMLPKDLVIRTIGGFDDLTDGEKQNLLADFERRRQLALEGPEE